MAFLGWLAGAAVRLYCRVVRAPVNRVKDMSSVYVVCEVGQSIQYDIPNGAKTRLSSLSDSTFTTWLIQESNV